MNYWTILIFAFLSINNSYAEERKRRPSYYLTSSKIDRSLALDKAVYTFSFNDLDFAGDSTTPIRYSIDGENRTERLIDGNELSVFTTPGKHIFQFFLTSDFFEIYTDSLLINPQYQDNYTLNFQHSYREEQAEKPVIYLYPQESTAIEFKINIKGERPFFYPDYGDGWQFTAQPNGDLNFDGASYNYLFWEASNVATLQSEKYNKGFVVEGSNSVNFLEEKLTEAGLSTKEQADFITYWAPRMQGNDFNFVHFVFNEACDRYATFEIDPQPDNIYRIYMVWTEVDSEYTVESQKIKSINREGFSVLEWGGQQTRFRRINCMAPLKATL
ncbi:MAG: hypothetical protein ACI865_002128 [Flavobacteriaceae bacterium]|jgi:hypothetical protein